MMREDAIGLFLGVLLVLSGLLILVLVAVMRRRALALAWLALFSLLYGLRLLIRTETFRLYIDAPERAWDYTIALITYAVPIPIVLFARAIFPAWRRFWTWGAIGMTAFAVFAIASDAMLERPLSMTAANNLIAIAFFLGFLVWILRPGLVPSRELRLTRVGALAASLTAVADNVRGMEVVDFPGPELEPFGFTVLIVCLGIIGVGRALAGAERLVAIDKELEIARQIQSSILPQSMPRIPGLSIVARYRPMTAVAGDFYDFLEIDAHRLGILVADVSGHGVPAALLASMVKVALAAQRDRAASPAAVLAGMNETLCGRLAGQYVTAAYLFIDTRSRVIRYGAAGHPPMLRVSHTNGTVDAVEQNGLILGFLENQPYRELEQALRPGDRFLLYTDGLIEASNADHDPFGLERVKAILAQRAGVDATAVAHDLLTAVAKPFLGRGTTRSVRVARRRRGPAHGQRHRDPRFER